MCGCFGCRVPGFSVKDVTGEFDFNWEPCSPGAQGLVFGPRFPAACPNYLLFDSSTLCLVSAFRGGGDEFDGRANGFEAVEAPCSVHETFHGLTHQGLFSSNFFLRLLLGMKKTSV